MQPGTEQAAVVRPLRLDPRLRGRAVDTLVAAFRDDPMDAYFCPDQAERAAAAAAMWDAQVRVTLAYGEAWTTPDVSGVALWLAPENALLGVRHMLSTGLALPRALLRFRGAARRRALAVFGYLDARHRQAVPGPHWYLWGLGVTPARQGRGIGSSLLAAVLPRAAAAGLPCYLETETERDVAFYRKHGFEVLAAERPPGHDLMLWTMARQPDR